MSYNRQIGSFNYNVHKASQDERSTQLLIRSIANGSITDRDRLLEYSVGEFYQEMSFFFSEVELKNKELKKLKK
jgi:hypothetical protein